MIADVLIVCNRTVGSGFFVGSSTKQNYENIKFVEMCNVHVGKNRLNVHVSSFLLDNLLAQIALMLS